VWWWWWNSEETRLVLRSSFWCEKDWLGGAEEVDVHEVLFVNAMEIMDPCLVLDASFAKCDWASMTRSFGINLTTMQVPLRSWFEKALG